MNNIRVHCSQKTWSTIAAVKKKRKRVLEKRKRQFEKKKRIENVCLKNADAN